MSQDQGNAGLPPLSLHRGIAAGIRQDIERQGLPAHSKLPSEVTLAHRYGVSRGTITKALDTLVQQGVVYRRRPRGTFVGAVPGPARPLPAASEPAPLPVVGLVVPFPPDVFVGGIILGVETVTRAAGYSLIFAYSENDPALERYHVEQFLRSHAAGILIFPADSAVEQRDGRLVSQDGAERAAMLAALRRQNVPFVLIDRYVPEVDCDYVVSDDTTAGYAATQHLIALGHRRVGFISITPPVTSTADRCAGYRHCLVEHHLAADESLILHAMRETSPPEMRGDMPAPGTGQADRALLRDYLRRRDRPTAIVAGNDYVGLRLLQAAEDVALEVPNDLAIVCCGGSDQGAHARVPLTSIRQPASELGRQAAHILLDHMTGRSSVVRRVVLPVSLVVRRSCGAAPRKTPLVVAQEPV